VNQLSKEHKPKEHKPKEHEPMNTNVPTPEILACDLTAIPNGEGARHITTAAELFQTVIESQPLPNGYALRLPNDAGMWLAVAQFIENERHCCPFFHFTLAVEPHNGPIWLRITGGEGVKELLETMLGTQADGVKLAASIQTGDNEALTQIVAEAIPRFAGTLQGKADQS